MIFINDIGKRFGTRNKLFINTKIFESISIMGTIVNDGLKSPDNCGGVAERKALAQIKGFAESIERRSLAIHSKQLDTLINGFDLINNEIVKVKESLTRYSLMKPYVDTTGTAVHTNSNLAKFNAVAELLEKNAVFLFWYGKDRLKFETTTKNAYAECLKKQGYDIHYFLMKEFSPLNIVIVLAINFESTLKYKFGVGSSLNLNDAILKATSEAYFLGNYYEDLLYSKEKQYSTSEELDKFFDEETLCFIRKIINEKSVQINNFNVIDETKSNDLYTNLPSWISQLIICILPQEINKRFIVVKAISDDLYGHIPKKEYLDLTKTINKQTINLTSDELEIIPDCPIV